MIFTRVYTLFFFLVSFGSLIASAKPIETTELVARTTGTYPAPTCNCGTDLVNVLAALKVNLAADIALLDGKHNPIADIVAELKAALAVIAIIKLDIPITKVQIDLCVSILVDIILSICAGLKLYGLLSIVLSLVGSLDLALSALISACVKLCVDIKLGLSLKLKLSILAQVKLLLTALVCGL